MKLWPELAGAVIGLALAALVYWAMIEQMRLHPA